MIFSHAMSDTVEWALLYTMVCVDWRVRKQMKNATRNVCVT